MIDRDAIYRTSNISERQDKEYMKWLTKMIHTDYVSVLRWMHGGAHAIVSKLANLANIIIYHHSSLS